MDEERDKTMKPLTKYALIGTGAYILLFVVFSLYRWSDIWCLELNALGDYVAGFFGPLALFWVVVGYFQQGEEVRNSTRELEFSVSELKRQADTAQQRYESEVEERKQEQARRKKTIAPHFILKVVSFKDEDGDRSATLELTNHGASVRNVVVTVTEGELKLDASKFEIVRADDSVQFNISWRRMGAFHDTEPVVFDVSYLDADVEYGSSKFKFQVVRGGLTRPRVLVPDNLPDE